MRRAALPLRRGPAVHPRARDPGAVRGLRQARGRGARARLESLRDVWRRREKPRPYEFSEFRREGNHQRQAETASAEIGGTGGIVKAVTTGGGATAAGSTAATAADTAVTTSWATVAAVSATDELVAGAAPTDSVICETVCAIAFTVAVVACATAAIVCVTGPLSPGLMRVEMFEFCG